MHASMPVNQQGLTRILGPGDNTAPVNSVLGAAENLAFRVESALPEPGRFGVAYLVPFYGGSRNHARIRIMPGNTEAFRIEACGYVSRMQKAFIEFDASGALHRRGEEIAAAQVACGSDGMLEVSLDFVAHRTRLEWLYVFALPSPNPGPASRPGHFSCGVFEFHCIGDHPGRNRQDPGTSPDGVFFSVDTLWIFRNYLHVEFELYKAGTRLSRLAIESSVKFETAQWWTHQDVGIAGFGQRSERGLALTPRRPSLALPSPRLMERSGPGCAWLGHCLTAVFGEFQDQRLWKDPESSQALSGIELHASFEDGSRARLPLLAGKRDAEPVVDPEFQLIRNHRKAIGDDRVPVFLEVGARGPSSVAVRSMVEDDYRYLGVDIMPGANVDVTGDAHRLSEVVEKGSVDVVYTNCVMEHLLNPAKFVVEASKVLRPGGVFIATIPVTWPLHAEPWDYWRISSHAWPSLLNHMTGFEIISVREHGEAAVVPSLTGGLDMVRMQYDPAPQFTSVTARKICEITSDSHAWSPQLASGCYDP